MGITKILTGLAVVLGSVSAEATILPPNNLHLQDNVKREANITEQEFNDIIDGIAKKFAPIVAQHGATLTVDKYWEDATVNAYAQQIGTTWNIAMFGGLARRPEVTKDGFALVVCHELGHHIAGFSYKGDYWASSEGQADYFATQACARELWAHEDNSAAAQSVDSAAKEGCDKAWMATASRNFCYRVAMAGQSLGTLLGFGSQFPKFETPDQSVVEKTYTSHPEAQCRLDTYYQGALCNVGFDLSLIPGKEHVEGQMSAAAEGVANKYSCNSAAGDMIGVRPACWFKSLVTAANRK